MGEHETARAARQKEWRLLLWRAAGLLEPGEALYPYYRLFQSDLLETVVLGPPGVLLEPHTDSHRERAGEWWRYADMPRRLAQAQIHYHYSFGDGDKTYVEFSGLSGAVSFGLGQRGRPRLDKLTPEGLLAKLRVLNREIAEHDAIESAAIDRRKADQAAQDAARLALELLASTLIDSPLKFYGCTLEPHMDPQTEAITFTAVDMPRLTVEQAIALRAVLRGDNLDG